jgi:hypothetical protein
MANAEIRVRTAVPLPIGPNAGVGRVEWLARDESSARIRRCRIGCKRWGSLLSTVTIVDHRCRLGPHRKERPAPHSPIAEVVVSSCSSTGTDTSQAGTNERFGVDCRVGSQCRAAPVRSNTVQDSGKDHWRDNGTASAAVPLLPERLKNLRLRKAMAPIAPHSRLVWRQLEIPACCLTEECYRRS